MLATRPAVVLVGHPSDEHCDHVGALLQKRDNVTVARLSRESLPEANFVWRPNGECRIGEVVPSFTAGWWRRPGRPRYEEYAHDVIDFVADECRDAFDGAIVSNGSNWLTHPRDLLRAELKLVQMQAANKLGLRLPATLVTNMAQEAQEFARTHGPVVVKPIRYGLVASQPVPQVAFTSEVTLADLESLSGPPVIVQERIPARVHLRVVTVGSRAFISTLQAAELDWRMELENHNRFVPDESERYMTVASSALRIARNLDLGFSAQDWIETPDREVYLLELNPSGQWLFLDDGHRGAIGNAVADELEHLGGAR